MALLSMHSHLLHAFPLNLNRVSRYMGTSPNIIKDLSKQSTALEVLRFLNAQKKLAPYVGADGVVVVTGGSNGIGAVSVETLALTGMKVVLCAQNVTKAQQVIDKFDDSIDKTSIRIQRLDLSDLNSVRQAAEDISQFEGQIDVLLNNAGVMAIPSKELTSQGFEKQLGINHIGHHYFTRKLLPSVKPNGRIVTVASTAHTMTKTLEIDDLNYDSRIYTGWDAYGQTKLANILFAKELQDRLATEGSDIKSVSLHPGVIKTNLWRYTTGGNFFVDTLTTLFADRNTDQGAATNVYCCLVNGSELQGGSYYIDCMEGYPNVNARDESRILRRRLWKKTEELLTEAGFGLNGSLLY